MRAHLLLVVLVFAATAPAGPARAAEDLDTAIVYVTGQYAETRLPGFARALEEVLVKASGNARLLGDPRVTAVTGRAGEYVETFSYRDRMAGIPVHDEQGTRQRPYALTVVFADESIAALLTQLGETPWLDRPEVMVLTTVATGSTRYALTSDGQHGRDFREALAAEARRAD